MKVAVLHYWFITRRGGEKVVEAILQLFPEADIYTLFYDREAYGNYLDQHRVFTSKYNFKYIKNNHQKVFPLYPAAVKSIQLQEDYDLIISSESGPIKGVEIPNTAKHVCYIHSPMRYCWGFTEDYLQTLHPFFRPVAKYFFKRLQRWDTTTVANVDVFVANSKNVANRVRNYYDREARVIHPPIEKRFFEVDLLPASKRFDYFISFGAITPYKRIDLLVDCFNKNGKRLIIIGEGSEKAKLQRVAKDNIEFVENTNPQKVIHTIQHAKALLFPGEEDFGMIPLEVMALGKPVIAFGKGGALETVVENRNHVEQSSGLFFKEQTVLSLQETIDTFLETEDQFDAKWIRNHAYRFEETKFFNSFKALINEIIEA